MGLISSRCAETAEPYSRTVLASMTRPCFSSMERSFRFPAGSCGSIQTTSMPQGLRKSTSQSRVVSGLDRAFPPVDQRHIVLSSRKAAVRRRRNAHITTTAQLEHKLGAVRAHHNDSVELRAMSKVEHRFDDPINRGRETRLDHNCACHLDSSFPAGWRELAKPLVLKPPQGGTFAASKVIGTNRALVAASLAARAAASNRSKKISASMAVLHGCSGALS